MIGLSPADWSWLFAHLRRLAGYGEAIELGAQTLQFAEAAACQVGIGPGCHTERLNLAVCADLDNAEFCAYDSGHHSHKFPPMALTLTELKAEFTAIETKVEGEAKAAWATMKAWFDTKESEIAKAVALLEGEKYTVTPPPKT